VLEEGHLIDGLDDLAAARQHGIGVAVLARSKPSLVPVRSSFSRSTQKSGMSGEVSML
jgi:hypothetical protein